MTKVLITKIGKSIVKVECDGHTNYGEAGEDIVCAALSSIVQTALMGLLTVAKINVVSSRDDKRGYLVMTLPEKLSVEKRHDADIILDTMMMGISDLNEGFSDFIELEVK